MPTYESGPRTSAIASPLVEVYLHGFGSSGMEFRTFWPPAPDRRVRIFLDAPEIDRFTGRRRWFPLTSFPASSTSGLRSAVDAAEQAIATELRMSELGPSAKLALIGHSQGGMVALAIAVHGRLNVRLVRAFASYLPRGVADDHPVGGRIPATSAKPMGVWLYHSETDPYVELSEVQSTARRLQVEHGARVHLCRSRALTHSFSAAWLDPASYSPT